MAAPNLASVIPKLPPGILFGGDYNPEQWPEDVWLEDARRMKEAGVNLVSVAIFAWAKLEPRPGEFQFEWLDRVIDILWAHGVSVCLATATATTPAWFARAYPESLPVEADGTRLSIGSRQHHCPNSRAYRVRAAELCRRLGQRYDQHPAVALWHLNNEVGCHVHACYCDVCAADFRTYLKNNYSSLDALNDAWGTAFWGQSYGDWEEIQPPRKAPTFRNPAQQLDYQRFMSASMSDLLRDEITALRSVAPTAKVVTNGMTFFKPTDPFDWAKHMDVAAWDAYPDPAGGVEEVRWTAFNHDLYRSVRGGQPFILMEQVTSQVNWRPTNVLKAPGQMRALSYQAMARGADGVMFFQWRASRAGAEKFHGAMLPHFGAENSRVFREAKELGSELKKLGGVTGARIHARVAMIVSWENRWALELEAKPTQFDYAEILQAFYGPIWDANVGIDLVTPDSDLKPYDLVLAPALYQLTRAQAERLREYVNDGGMLVMSYFSGVTDERERVWLGGYPALLQDVLGLAVEEWQPLRPGETVAVVYPRTKDTRPLEVLATKFCEGLHLRGATPLATYAQNVFAGRPAITRNVFGKGEAYYVSTLPEPKALAQFLDERLRARSIVAPAKVDPGVELSVRCGDGGEFLFVINQTPTAARVEFTDWHGIDLLTGSACKGPQMLEPFGVRIVRPE